MAEHVPKRERLMRASLKDAGESMSDYLEEHGAVRTAHPPAGAVDKTAAKAADQGESFNGGSPESSDGEPLRNSDGGPRDAD